MRRQAKFYIVIYKTKPIHHKIKFLKYETSEKILKLILNSEKVPTTFR